MSVGVSPFEVESAAGVSALRAAGVARLTAECMAGETVAVDIDEEGPLRLRFPRIKAEGSLDTVIVNTGGGVAGGDSLVFEIAAGEGARVAITSQASEKIYRAANTDADASIHVRLTAKAKARLAWVPQESILFDRARVVRRIDADVAENAELTICESVVFGRTAMGETVRTGRLKDRWQVRREGKLIFADALTLDGKIDAALARPAVAQGAIAAGIVLQASQDAESKIDAVREALDRTMSEHDGIESGASTFDGLLSVRILAHDSLGLRAAILATLSALGSQPPRAFSL
jgi:urease accessory protein